MIAMDKEASCAQIAKLLNRILKTILEYGDITGAYEQIRLVFVYIDP